MLATTIQYQQGIYLPGLRLWLDPHEPQNGPDRVCVSHAHSDHIGLHREVILSAPTARLMQARLGTSGLEHVLTFGETRRFEGTVPFDCTLLGAGHIFGSAMAFLEYEGCSLLYTGDFKLRRGLSAEPCEPRPADFLVMETTFGLPQYRFPPADAVMRGIVRFCREALDNDETPVLLGYSLGKCQELLCGLSDAGLPIMLHGTVYNLTKIYEQFGTCFPKYERYDPATARGHVLLCPPAVANSLMLKNLGQTRTAILTGWAVDPNCRYRYQVDAAFPLSDHADFPELIRMVEAVQPKKVYTLHGYAAEFAQTLRELGFNAQVLHEREQLSLALGNCSGKQKLLPQPAERRALPVPQDGSSPAGTSGSMANSAATLAAANTFLQFAQTCLAIAGTSSKLEKVRLLAEYLRALPPEALPLATTWFTGAAFPPSQNKALQLGWALIRDATCAVAHISGEDFHHVYLKHSDLGETAFEIIETWCDTSWPRGSALSVPEVNLLFEQLYTARGPTGKRPVLQRALERCSPMEAKFLVKILTGDLRIGLKEGLVEEGVARAFEAAPEAVRQANLLLGNIGETALLARHQNLANATIQPFRAVKFMLASPEETAADLWLRGTESGQSLLWLEDKYDGIRCQLHKSGERVALYSRDLKEITDTFPELAAAARRLQADVILDGEIVAWRGEQVLPFAELQKRLGRREYDLFMHEEAPIQYVVFDLLWQNGGSRLNEPLRLRRAALEALMPLPALFRLAQVTPAASVAAIEKAFTAARERNNEGLMAKNPESLYSPGRRGLAWLKLKKPLATLDCVVVGAEYGHGKRNKVLSDYTFAVRDEESGELKTIGKAYSGLTDAEIQELTQHFLRSAIRQHGRYFEVPPEIVLEIAFDRIAPSTRHNSGLAMRFPRIVRIRTDKSAAEIDTLANARKLVK